MADIDPEKEPRDQQAPQPQHHHSFHGLGQFRLNKYQCKVMPFAGRLGGQQVAILDREDEKNARILQQAPDAAPYMTLKEQFDLRPFRAWGLWKAAFVEGMGTLMLVFVTIWANISPNVLPEPFTPLTGSFDNASFFGPLVGGVINFLILTLVTFSYGAVSGAHLNPTITFGTFCARLCSLPRMVLYIAFQIGGAALAGLLARAAYGTRDFKVGGCWLYTDHVPVGDAWVVEFVFCAMLLFFAFGVGLDPRQAQTIGPKLAPFLVGLALGVLSFGSAFSRYGYGGASLNPARCFGTFVGSRFPGWHWMHWVADFTACIVHACFYFLIPPWEGLQQS